MKRILFIFILLMGISQAKDKDGIFLGFELGLGKVKTTTPVSEYPSTIDTFNLPMYGFRLGYVKYFGDLFGINTYASFKDVFQSGNNSNSGKDFTHIMSFAANIDYLLDFYNDKSLSMGGFAGVGIGSTNIKIRDSRSFGFDEGVSKDTVYGIYTDFKAGLKTSYKHNSISLIASFPIIPTKEVGYPDKEGNWKSKTNYTISLAYDYRF